MPTALTTSLEIPPPQAPPQKRWSRLELVGGELISKMGKNWPHVNGFTIMHLWLLKVFGKQFECGSAH